MKYLTFFLATALFAAKPDVTPGCPGIVIERSRSSFETYINMEVPLVVRNHSDKTIDALQLTGEFSNPFHEKIPFTNTCTFYKLKPGKYDHGSCDTGVLKGTSIKSWTVWLTRMAYEDGTLWSDDGSHSCAFTWELRR